MNIERPTSNLEWEKMKKQKAIKVDGLSKCLISHGSVIPVKAGHEVKL